MKVLRNIFLGFVLLFSLSLHAQPTNWSPISQPDPAYNARRFCYSENLDMTIYCGLFQEGPGHYYLAGYNGETWEMLLDTMFGEIRCVVDYLDGVLMGGSNTSQNFEIHPIGFYDGQEWSYPWQFNGNVRSLVWTNDTLFATGNFTEIDGEPIYKIAKLVNGQWEAVILPSDEVDYGPLFNDIAYYDGYYYVGGNFHPEEGPDDFARINNMQLEQVGEGLFGSWVMVSSLEVYQDELYIGGKIPLVQGNVGNHIVRWNGSSYASVGEPMTIHQGEFSIDGGAGWLDVKGDYLYCMGRFRFIGQDSISLIARWDGNEWCGLWGSSFLHNTTVDSDIVAAGYFQDKFMIERYYEYEDGSVQRFWLFDGGDEVELCTESVSVRELYKETAAFNLYPNPAQNQITIQCDEQIVRVEMLDVSGRVVQASGALPKNGLIEIGSLPSGIYLVKVETADGGLGLRKLVVD